MSSEKLSKPDDVKRSLKKLSEHLREQNETLRKLLEELSEDKAENSE